MIDARACPECGAGVPTGRFSCGACGALLASVDARRAADPAPDGGTRSGWDAAAPASPPHGSADPGPVSTLDPPEMVPQPDREIESTNVAGAGAAPSAAPATAGTLDAPPEAPATTGTLDAPPAAPAKEEPQVDRREAHAQATPAVPESIELPRPPMPPIPGAYLAPSSVMRSAPVAVSSPAAAASAARPAPEARPEQPAPAWSEARPERPAPAGLSPRGSEPSPPNEAASGSPARVPVLELPFAIAPGIGPRLVAGGAALAVVAFVLPWVGDGGVVVGGTYGSGYFATWGLAAVGNVLPFLLAWVSLVLAVLPNRLPRFAALGLLPLHLGGIFAGLGWMYLIAPLGTGIGIWALEASALCLAAGGTLVLREARAA